MLDTDQTAGLTLLVVGVLPCQTVESALYRDQLAAQLPECSGDVPVVFSAHLDVAQFPGFLHLQHSPGLPVLETSPTPSLLTLLAMSCLSLPLSEVSGWERRSILLASTSTGRSAKPRDIRICSLPAVYIKLHQLR